MPKNTFISLLVALGSGITGGLISLLVVSSLLNEHFRPQPEDFFSAQSGSIIAGLALSFILPFILCIAVLLPLAAIEKVRIEASGFKELMLRYIPLLSIPIGTLFLWLLCDSFADENDRFAFL